MWRKSKNNNILQGSLFLGDVEKKQCEICLYDINPICEIAGVI